MIRYIYCDGESDADLPHRCTLQRAWIRKSENKIPGMSGARHISAEPPCIHTMYFLCFHRGDRTPGIALASAGIFKPAQSAHCQQHMGRLASEAYTSCQQWGPR